MALTIHVGRQEKGLFVTNENAAARRAAEKAQGEGKKSSVFAGDLGIVPDKIQMKRQQAQKQAMKIVGDTFAAEKELDQGMAGMEDRIRVLQEENAGYHDELKRIRNTRDELMENYGVGEDSEELDDLELLRKEKKAQDKRSGVTLDYEEEKRLKEIHEKGLTGYQKDMMALDDEQEKYEADIAGNEESLKGLRMALSDTKIERLKKNPMLEAQEEADAIMEAANKEIFGELVNEGKKHIEEKMAEEKEKAEKRAEKKEEEDEKKEAAEERRAEMEAQIEDTRQKVEVKKEELPDAGDQEKMVSYNNPNASKTEAEKALEEILDELKLIQDDLKGAAVDENL